MAREHRFDKFQARIAAIKASVKPETAAERQEYLKWLDRQVVVWYRAHSGKIHVVTGALMRALTAIHDSARVLDMKGDRITLDIKHPGAYYHQNIVMPAIPFAEVAAEARRRFLASKR